MVLVNKLVLLLLIVIEIPITLNVLYVLLNMLYLQIKLNVLIKELMMMIVKSKLCLLPLNVQDVLQDTTSAMDNVQLSLTMELVQGV